MIFWSAQNHWWMVGWSVVTDMHRGAERIAHPVEDGVRRRMSGLSIPPPQFLNGVYGVEVRTRDCDSRRARFDPGYSPH